MFAPRSSWGVVVGCFTLPLPLLLEVGAAVVGKAEVAEAELEMPVQSPGGAAELEIPRPPKPGGPVLEIPPSPGGRPRETVEEGASLKFVVLPRVVLFLFRDATPADPSMD